VSEEPTGPESLVEAALAAQTPSQPETPTEPPAEPETAPESPEEPEGATTDEEPSGEDASLLEFVRDELGKDLSGKFKDDAEFLKWAVNAESLIGKRDEDAVYGKQIRQLLAGNEAAFQEFLSGRQQAQATPQPAAEQPVSYEQWQLMQAQVASGKASPAVKERFERIQDEIARRLYESATVNPLQAAVEQRLQTLESQFEQRLSQREMQDQLSAWDRQNAATLYVNSDPNAGFTPVGKRFEELFQETQAEIPGVLSRAKYALRMAQAEQPKPNPTRKPPQKAKHQPAIAVPPATAKTQADLLDQGLTFAQIAMAAAKPPE
jgi:hypothetical protein